MVLVGKTGVGKSETGNTIAGAGAGTVTKIFTALARAMSVTKKCKQHCFQRFGDDLQLVDVPGFCDTVRSHDDIKEEIMKCIGISSPGIHAILFIVRVGRFTEEDKNTLETFLRCFGEESKRFVIIVFTGKDDLEADNDTLDNYLGDCPVTLKKFLFDVSRRCIAVNNRGTDAEKEKFAKDLIAIVKSMVGDNGGQCYTNEMYERCEAVLREAEKKEKLEEKREKQLEEKLKQEAAAYEEMLQRQHLKMQNLERQLHQKESRLKALAEQKEAAAEENRRREDMRHEEARKQIREKVEKGNTSYLGTAYRWVKSKIATSNPFG
ncbi:GTPase IMAP family member 4-like [Haliotis cracherodii]|uniref:GTPase IMAP family member 4-like n=1 Tax=Haliotis cracherodii TaxID=6455 RepID=UPI0039EAE037